MMKLYPVLFLALIFFSCATEENNRLNDDVLTSLGKKYSNQYERDADKFADQISADPTDVDALLGFAETKIILYIFGFVSRDAAIPEAIEAFEKAQSMNPQSAEVHTVSGMLHLLEWDWDGSRDAFRAAIEVDPLGANQRHWYSLYLSIMGHFDQAMLQSDTIMTLDPSGDYLVGRGSLLYFARRNIEMRELMI